MFCPQCGEKLPDDAKFCPQCGARSEGASDVTLRAARPLTSPPTSTTPQRPAAVPPATPRMTPLVDRRQRPHRTGAMALAALGALATLVVLVAVFVSLSASSESASTTAETSAESAQETSETTSDHTEEAAPSKDEDSSDADESSDASSTGDYLLAQSDTRIYSSAELEKLSTDELWLARNEIYARHGRGFSDSTLQTYFDEKTWYRQTYTPEEFDELPNQLNATEQANADAIYAIEESRGSSHL